MLQLLCNRFTKYPPRFRLALACFCLFLFILLSRFVYLRDIPHLSSYYHSKWNNYRDDGIGDQICRIRKSPIVLVASETSSIVVFESTCSHTPKLTLWKHDGQEVHSRTEIRLVNVAGQALDSSHYVWLQSIGTSFPSLLPCASSLPYYFSSF
jgi:hypothetical protein